MTGLRDTKMTKFNPGTFSGDDYIKEVDWNKAVLWMTRQISLRPSVCEEIVRRGTKRVIFIDKVKGIKHIADVSVLRENKKLKRVGQEEQFYFPISIFTEEKIGEPKPMQIDFGTDDESNNPANPAFGI